MNNTQHIVNAALKFLERRFSLLGDKVVKAIDGLKKGQEAQTKAISALGPQLRMKQKAPEVKVDVDMSVIEAGLASIEGKIPKGQKTDLKMIEGALGLILTAVKENKPEEFRESFDAFGKAVLENKPKDEISINSAQMKGLMSAILNGGGSKEAPNGGLYSGRQVVAAAATAVQLQTDDERCENITITAESDNAGLISVGDSSVVAAEGTQQGAILTPLGSITVKVGRLSKIYIDATVSGDGVSYAYER